MKSGLKFQEIDPIRVPYFGLANLYLSNNVMRTIQKAKFIEPPGGKTKYSSLDNQILGIALERASGKTMLELIEEKLWIPLGMQNDARWAYDSKKYKNIRTYCCIKANALDYARLGRLYLNYGNWDGTQIVPEEYVRYSTQRILEKFHYQWMLNYRRPYYSAEGLYGQFLYLNPKTNMIFIRLGKKYDIDSEEIFREIEGLLEGREDLVMLLNNEP